MKDILVIQGGGRPKGNTAQLIDSFVEGVKDTGHSVEVISLIKNEVKGVLAVMHVDMENHAFKKMRSMILLPG